MMQTILSAAKEFNKIPICFSCTKNGTQQEAETRISQGFRMLIIPGCTEAKKKLGKA